MASIYTGKQAPIHGPYVKQAFAKSIYKGEDAWLQQRDIEVSVPAIGGVPAVLKSLPCSCMQHEMVSLWIACTKNCWSCTLQLPCWITQFPRWIYANHCYVQ